MRSGQIAFVAFVAIQLFGFGAVAGLAGANYLGAFDKKKPQPLSKEAAEQAKNDAERASVGGG